MKQRTFVVKYLLESISQLVWEREDYEGKLYQTVIIYY